MQAVVGFVTALRDGVALRLTAVGIILCMVVWLFVLLICLCLMQLRIKRPANRPDRTGVPSAAPAQEQQ